MGIYVTKVNFTGYIVSNSDYAENPNNWQIQNNRTEALMAILEDCMSNSFKCTMDMVDSFGEMGCDCTECTCQPSTSEVLTIANLDQPGESADTIIEEKELSL